MFIGAKRACGEMEAERDKEGGVDDSDVACTYVVF
jgi:hypothetical protein